MMNFPHILALMDEELERLQTAREILATFLPEVPAKQTRAVRQPKQQPMSADLLASEAETPTVSKPSPPVRKLKRLPRIDRKLRVAEPPQPLSSPLGPAPHTGPVFVKAELVPLRHPSPRSASSDAQQWSEPPRDLTAEALARRWLTGSLSLQ